MRRLAVALLAAISAIAAGGEARVERIDLAKAHALALACSPEAVIARLRTVAAADDVALARAPLLPTLNAVGSFARADNDGVTRIGAGALNTPTIYDRSAVGLSIAQLITDFGQSFNRLAQAKADARATQRESEAAILRLLYDVDVAYFTTLRDEGLLAVADKAVETRAAVAERLQSMVANKLKSELDLGYARVALEQARLMHAKVVNDRDRDQLVLAAMLGFDEAQPFELAPEPVPSDAPLDPSDLVRRGLRSNPDIVALRDEVDARRYGVASARDANLPTIWAVGVAGRVTDADGKLPDSYAAAGLTMSLPLFAGGAISARTDSARVSYEIAQARLNAATDDLSRDIRIAAADVGYARQRLAMTQSLQTQAEETESLARTRFENGLNSIIDLNTAELSATDAAMAHSAAEQDLLIRLSTLDLRIGGKRRRGAGADRRP